MNQKNPQSAMFRARASVVGLGKKIAAGSALVAAGVGSAMAAAPDVTSITTELSDYKLAVVGLVIAFAVILWAIRGAGLLKPR